MNLHEHPDPGTWCPRPLSPFASKIGECAIQAAIAAGIAFMQAFIACMTTPVPPPPPPPDGGDRYNPGTRVRCP